MQRKTKLAKIKKSKRELELQRQYAKFVSSLDSLHPHFSNSNVKLSKAPIMEVKIPPGRESPSYPSFNSGQGSTARKEDLFYSGNKMKGIGTLHKSNGVPVFSDEEAVDIATMRR